MDGGHAHALLRRETLVDGGPLGAALHDRRRCRLHRPIRAFRDLPRPRVPFLAGRSVRSRDRRDDRSEGLAATGRCVGFPRTIGLGIRVGQRARGGARRRAREARCVDVHRLGAVCDPRYSAGDHALAVASGRRLDARASPRVGEHPRIRHYRDDDPALSTRLRAPRRGRDHGVDAPHGAARAPRRGPFVQQGVGRRRCRARLHGATGPGLHQLGRQRRRPSLHATRDGRVGRR